MALALGVGIAGPALAQDSNAAIVEEACAALTAYSDALTFGSPDEVEATLSRLNDAVLSNPDAFPKAVVSSVEDESDPELQSGAFELAEFCRDPAAATKASKPKKLTKASKKRARKKACAAVEDWNDALDNVASGEGSLSDVTDAEEEMSTTVRHNKKAFPHAVVAGIVSVGGGYDELIEFCENR